MCMYRQKHFKFCIFIQLIQVISIVKLCSAMEFIIFHPPSSTFLYFVIYRNQWVCVLKQQILRPCMWTTDLVGLRKDPGTIISKHYAGYSDKIRIL